MISSVFDILLLFLLALFIILTLGRVGCLQVNMVIVDGSSICIVFRAPFGIATTASIFYEARDLLVTSLLCLLDVIILLAAILVLSLLNLSKHTPDDTLAPGPRRLLLPLGDVSASAFLALVPYTGASSKTDSTCRALVMHVSHREVAPLVPRPRPCSHLSLPGLMADSSVSTAPSSPYPRTPRLSSTLSITYPRCNGDEELSTSPSFSSCLPSVPTVRQLEKSLCSVPLVGGKERAIAMLLNVNGRSKFSDFPIKDLMVERELGKGAFGAVLLSENEKTGEKFAVKMIAKEKDPQMAELQRKYIRNEIEAQSTMSSSPELFVQLLGAYQTSSHYLLIMPYCDGGDLEGWLQREKRFSIQRTVNIVAQLLHMIDLMSRQGILHRDLKPGNILLDQHGYIRASDFGLCHRYSWVCRQDDLYNKNFELNEGVGTPAYAPPEMTIGEAYNRWVDLYALGIMTYEMLTGELPERDELETDFGTIFDHPDFCTIHPQHSEYLEYDALDFIKTLMYNPDEPHRRASISSIKAHPFLRDAPWHEIENDLTFTMV